MRCCGSKRSKVIYNVNWEGADISQDLKCNKMVSVVKCENCGLLYSREILSQSGKEKFWRKYSSQVHEAEKEKNEKRKIMYRLEHDFIHGFMDKSKRSCILDVGCAEGGFLDLFEDCDRYGVEIGREAAEKAQKKYKVYEGEFPDLDIKEKFDLIIFRGTIQYFEKPRDYFDKAVGLLKRGGKIYISSSPRSDAFLHMLFQDRFTLPVCAVAGKGFSTDVLKTYFAEKDMFLCGEKYFYEETPYANIEDDIRKVAYALNCKREGRNIGFRAPAFWGNLMSLVFSLR